MRLVVQRVKNATVQVDNQTVGAINKGLLVFLGVGKLDNQEDLDWLVKKLLSMRIFADENGKMNKSVLETNGSVLLVSQFTLHASTKKGNRPSFLAAADPALAKDYYQKFGELIKASKIHLQTGLFGADMQIELVNDGPVTMCLDSKNKE